MTICIAKSKETLGHYVMRTADKKTFNYMPDEQLPAFINALLSAKGHKQLIRALEGAPLLYETNIRGKQPDRVMSPDDCIRALEEQFTEVDPKILSWELFMYAPKEIRANVTIGKSPASELDAYKNHFAEELSKLGDDKVIIVESIEDWMTVRNMLSVVAALLSGIENPEKGARVLENAGFFMPDRNAFNQDVFVTRLKFQAGTFLLQFMKHPVVSSGLLGRDLDYLYNLYYKDTGKPRKRGGLLFPVMTRGIGGCDDVFITAHYDAVKGGINLIDIALAPWEEDRYVYLCVEKHGSQLEMAKRAVLALWNATCSLKDFDGAMLGITEDIESLFMPKQETMSFTYHSLVSRLWNALCFHKGKRLITCRHCGCGVLASNRGPVKEYCSDSCRVQDKARQ